LNRPRFLADHNLDDAIIDGVRRRAPAADCALARDLGLERVPDTELLEYAAVNAYVVVSYDRQTLVGFAEERMRSGRRMSGLIIAKARSIGPSIQDLLAIWYASEAEEWDGQIRFLPL
jgi:hypothetical protein